MQEGEEEVEDFRWVFEATESPMSVARDECVCACDAIAGSGTRREAARQAGKGLEGLKRALGWMCEMSLTDACCNRFCTAKMIGSLVFLFLYLYGLRALGAAPRQIGSFTGLSTSDIPTQNPPVSPSVRVKSSYPLSTIGES